MASGMKAAYEYHGIMTLGYLPHLTDSSCMSQSWDPTKTVVKTNAFKWTNIGTLRNY